MLLLIAALPRRCRFIEQANSNMTLHNHKKVVAPYAVLENEDDVTTARSAALGQRPAEALSVYPNNP